jgi:hypothetical protein
VVQYKKVQSGARSYEEERKEVIKNKKDNTVARKKGWKHFIHHPT